MLQAPRYPERFSREEFYPFAYRVMYFSRRLEDQLIELFHKGYVKGTVTSSRGNEATAVGMSLPLRPAQDPVSLLHRDFASHLVLGATPYQLVCQYMANADSPTHGREGNAHHGDSARRRFPMISHLGRMPSLVVGATWAARRNGEDVIGLAVVGDGGSSTGEIHESMNLASVQRVPVLFLMQNNHYSFSTPTSVQYHCRRLSDRAAGYGITGRTIDGTDPWLVYTTVCDLIDVMREESLPAVLECMTYRLMGHAAYDKGEYVPAERMEEWRRKDPVPCTRAKLIESYGMTPADVAAIEAEADEECSAVIARAVRAPRPDPRRDSWRVHAERTPRKVEPVKAVRVKNGDAVRRALEFILAHDSQAYLMGLDVGVYGSAFKTCKGLFDRFGPERVMDMPICEPATVGFALGSSQVGARPIMEFQFADFAVEAVTQIGLNASTWYYRAGCEAPLVLRLPCGGGLTMGAFHSGEFEGLWTRFPGLKMLYPATAQETFEALLAAYHDPNPCLVMENKLLYWSKSGDIDFDGDVERIWRPRRYTEGEELTLVATGAMVHEALAAVRESGRAVDVWNPFVLAPLQMGPIIESVARTGRLMVVQESGETQGLGDRMISLIVRQAHGALKAAPRLLASLDVPVPFAPELETHFRPNAERILSGIREMLGVG